jgi:hypothetical protein
MSNKLIISGYSDDCLEFDGAFREEYYVYSPAVFDVTLTSPRGERSFTLEAEFGYAWSLKFAWYGLADDEPQDNIWTGIEFSYTGKNRDPQIVIPVDEDEVITVERYDESD